LLGDPWDVFGRGVIRITGLKSSAVGTGDDPVGYDDIRFVDAFGPGSAACGLEFGPEACVFGEVGVWGEVVACRALDEQRKRCDLGSEDAGHPLAVRAICLLAGCVYPFRFWASHFFNAAAVKVLMTRSFVAHPRRAVCTPRDI